MSTIQQFEYFQLDSNKIGNTEILVTNTPFVIGEVVIDEVIPGDTVWLNAVIGGVDNENVTAAASIQISLYKGNVLIPGKEIYSAVQEIDKEGEADLVNVPLSHVDAINKAATNVRYVLTVKLNDKIKNVFIRGPITFTALRIRP